MKLFQTRSRIEQMMSTMRELLQAKSADGGQQREQLDGTGMRDAKEDSDEAGRVLREEGATGTRVDTTTSTRDSFHADIKAAHDDGGVLSSGSEITPCCSACDEGRESRVPKFKHEFLLKANMLDISGHFVGQGIRVVPVGDPLKQKAVLLRESFSSEEIRGAYQAWNLSDGALQSEADISILKRVKSP